MKLKRALAVAALILIALLLLLLLFMAFTGAQPEHLLAVLFSLMVLPAVIYIYIWFTKLTRKK